MWLFACRVPREQHILRICLQRVAVYSLSVEHRTTSQRVFPSLLRLHIRSWPVSDAIPLRTPAALLRMISQKPDVLPLRHVNGAPGESATHPEILARFPSLSCVTSSGSPTVRIPARVCGRREASRWPRRARVPL